MNGSRALASLVVASIAVAGSPANAGDPLFALAAWQAMPGPMPLPVFDGAATIAGRHLVVLGGCTRDLTATQAIQIRHPIHGWMPIGSSLLEPRAKASITPLADGRVLVLGGWNGTWGKDAVHHADGELLDPLVAGTSLRVPAWDEPLEGHSATPLADGRIAVVKGCTARAFDPATNRWSPAIALERSRTLHAAVRVGEHLLLIGGEHEATIESIDFSEADPESVLWPVSLPSALVETSAAPAGRGLAMVAGGVAPDGSTVDRTYLLDVANRSLRPGPGLGLPRGACRLALVPHPRGLLVLDGEWRLEGARGSADAAMILRPLAKSGERDRWALPKLGPLLDTARRIVVVAPDGSVEIMGGYRFVPPSEGREAGDVGVVVEGSGQRLVVDAVGVAD